MTEASGPPAAGVWRRGRVEALLLLTAALGLGFVDLGGPVIGVVLTIVPVAVGVVLRSWNDRTFRAIGTVLPIVGIGLGAVTARTTVTAALFAGVASSAYLLWLSIDAPPTPESFRNAVQAITLPLLAVLVALASSLLLPSTTIYIGVSAGVLMATLVVVAYLFERPSMLEPRATDS